MAFLKKESPFQAMQKIGRTINLYSSLLNLVEWDQETYMPLGAIEVRSLQIEALSGLIHKQKTSPSFKKALGKLVDLETGHIFQQDLSWIERKAVSLWYKNWKQDTKIPSSFVKKCAKLSSASLHTWSESKKKSDFFLFAPLLKKTITLAQKKAELLGYQDHPYDALLDLYEPGMTVAKLEPLFKELKKSLTSLLQNIQKAPVQKTSPLPTSFDRDLQMKLGKELLNALGFSEDLTRLDLSSHPFCMGIHPLDTRMTTRIFEDHLMSHIFSVLHESGHGLYNAQLPIEYYGTPLCEPLSYGVDESQSRLWETLIGRSKPFWDFFYPILQTTFPQELGHVPFSDFYKNMNTVNPSLIRVEADEVTYCLHIILRFEIEKALIEGSLEVKEIPKVWKEKMDAYLGIIPSSDSEGCLQDIHWAVGSFGYFPTYALGNLLAAQLYETLKISLLKLEEDLSKGNFIPIREWLKHHIHQKGKLYTAEELILSVTGKPLSSSCYTQYLENKYRKIYRF